MRSRFGRRVLALRPGVLSHGNGEISIEGIHVGIVSFGHVIRCFSSNAITRLWKKISYRFGNAHAFRMLLNGRLNAPSPHKCRGRMCIITESTC